MSQAMAAKGCKTAIMIDTLTIDISVIRTNGIVIIIIERMFVTDAIITIR